MIEEKKIQCLNGKINMAEQFKKQKRNERNEENEIERERERREIEGKMRKCRLPLKTLPKKPSPIEFKKFNDSLCNNGTLFDGHDEYCGFGA